MTAKHVFALYGKANVGKSAALKKVFTLLTDAYPAAPVQTISDGIDITVIIDISGVLLGIETQGDPNSRLGESLELFKKAKCSIIICATRTRGGTVTAVENLQPEFEVVWHHKASEPKAKLRDQHDSSIAQIIFDEVQSQILSR